MPQRLDQAAQNTCSDLLAACLSPAFVGKGLSFTRKKERGPWTRAATDGPVLAYLVNMVLAGGDRSADQVIPFPPHSFPLEI